MRGTESAERVDTVVLDRAAIDWLLASDEPGIRLQARRDLLDEETAEDPTAVLDGPRVRALLEGQQPDGGFGVHPYHKWLGAHWRLVALVELGVPAGEPRALAAYATVLEWLRQRQRADGRWNVSGAPMWSAAGRYHPEAVAWERRGPSLMLTLNALRVLRAAGRLARSGELRPD